jgi:hypothetical protein
VADNSHKRDTNARRFPKAHLVAGPLAFLATASAVGVGVANTDSDTRESLVSSSSTSVFDASAREEVLSRSESRRESANLQKAFELSMARTATRAPPRTGRPTARGAEAPRSSD